MKIIVLAIILALSCIAGPAQTTPKPSPSTTPVQRRAPTAFDLSEYGVALRTEPRLTIMMAALEAAGFQASESGAQPSVFRAQVRKDLTDLDPDLRSRLKTF